MLSRTAAAALLLIVALGGCLGDGKDLGSEGPHPPISSTPSSHDYWNYTLEDETILVRVDTEVGFNITLGGTWFQSEDFIFGMFLYNFGHVLIISHNYEAQVGYNDVEIGTGVTAWGGQSRNYTFFDEPGVHTIAFYGQGRPTPVNLTTKDGTIEVLSNQTAQVRYYKDNHPDWEKTHVFTPHLQVMKGTLNIEPASEVMEVIGLGGGSPATSTMELHLPGETCEAQFRFVMGLSGQPVSLDVDQIIAGGMRYATEVFVVDWPFDLGGHGCFQRPP